MKKLIAFLIILMTSFAGHSQTSSDTVVLRISDAKRVLKAAENSKILALELEQKTFEINKLNERINLKTENITDMQKRLDIRADIIEKLQQNERLVSYNNELLTQQYNAFKKESQKAIKQQKNKSFWRGAGVGIAVTILSIFLIK